MYIQNAWVSDIQLRRCDKIEETPIIKVSYISELAIKYYYIACMNITHITRRGRLYVWEGTSVYYKSRCINIEYSSFYS